MTRRPLVGVPDHALLRFLERVDGVKVEETRKLIQLLAQPAMDAGARFVSIGDGFRLCIKAGVVTTVLAPGMARHTVGIE